MTKYIQLDYRQARTQDERQCFAITCADSHSAEVFVNTRKNAKSETLIDTFFHEMVHVFLAFHSKDGQMSPQKEEILAKKVAALCAEALR